MIQNHFLNGSKQLQKMQCHKEIFLMLYDIKKRTKGNFKIGMDAKSTMLRNQCMVSIQFKWLLQLATILQFLKLLNMPMAIKIK